MLRLVTGHGAAQRPGELRLQLDFKCHVTVTVTVRVGHCDCQCHAAIYFGPRGQLLSLTRSAGGQGLGSDGP